MKDIKILTAEITLREKQISLEEKKELEILLRLGEAVYSADAENPPKEEIGVRIHSLLSEIDELNENLSDLKECEKRQKVIAEEKKSLNVELKNLKGRESALTETLARSSWDVWKSDGDKFPGLEEPLEDLIKAESRLSSVEDAMEQNTNNFLRKKIFKRGFSALLSGRRKTELIIQERLWNKVGKKVFEAVDASVLSGTPAQGAHTDLQELESRRESLKSRIKEMDEESAAMEKPFGNFSVPGSFRIKILAVQKSLSGKEERLANLYREFGRTRVEEDNGAALPSKAASHKKEWDILQTAIQKLEEEKIALKAQQAYLKRQAERNRQAERVSALESQIKEKEAALKDMRGNLDSMDEELIRMKNELPGWIEG